MIPQPKIEKILERLLERSRANEVNWIGADHGGDEYYVRFPESMIRISRIAPSAEPDYIRVDLLDKYEEAVGSTRFYEGNDHRDLASSLFNEADRMVRGRDKVLEDVEKAINSDQRVGLPAQAGTRS